MFLFDILSNSQAVDVGLIVAAFAFGLRHGIDWDHIAAITDITASQDSPRVGLKLGTLYVLGHAAVVFVLGVAAILVGDRLPPAVDEVIGKVVGVTLVGLGIYVIYSLIRHRREFRMQSRWMLALRGVRAAYRWAMGLQGSRQSRGVEHDHSHALVGGYHHDNEDAGVTSAEGHLGMSSHAHPHRHHDSADPLASYSAKTAFGVGALHGIGAETPTQVLIFLAAAGAGGPIVGLVVLAAFLVGLAISNSVITLSSAFGFLAASRRFGVYASVGAITGVVSMGIGILFLAGQETLLPAILGG